MKKFAVAYCSLLSDDAKIDMQFIDAEGATEALELYLTDQKYWPGHNLDGNWIEWAANLCKGTLEEALDELFHNDTVCSVKELPA